MIDPVPSDSLRAFLEAASAKYHEAMWGTRAEEYLVVDRGLSREMVERFRLGYVSDPLPGHERMRGRISIPYLTPDDSVVSIRFRLLDTEIGDKYHTMKGEGTRLYNTAALEEGTSGLVLCEGEIDTVTSKMCGFPTVGVPGATTWQAVWSRLMWQYSVIYLPHDDDDAGRTMADNLAAQLSNIRPIPMTGGDVNSFVRDNGVQAYRERILGS